MQNAKTGVNGLYFNSKRHQHSLLTLAGFELGSETPAGWSTHVGGTQMASALNMDEGSDTTTQTDSMEERERKG